MEFEDVREQMEWEARRVAAAFGARNIYAWSSSKHTHFNGDFDGDGISFAFRDADGVFDQVVMGSHLNGVDVQRIPRSESWYLATHEDRLKEDYLSKISRGFYCLGIEDEAIWARLPELSAHEKLELRLSLPREFWPQKWLQEEK